MNAVGQVLDGLADELRAIGWEAVRDPDLVAPTVSGAGRCAFVGLPTIAGYGVGGRLTLTIPVHLLTVPTMPGYDALLGLLPATIAALGMVEELPPQSLQIADDIQLPGYRLTVTRRTTC